MKLANLRWIGMAAVLPLAAVVACSDDDATGSPTTTPDAGGGTDAMQTEPPDTTPPDASTPNDAGADAAADADADTYKGAAPPPPGPVSQGDNPNDTTFVINKLYFGDTNPDGTLDKANGWKQYGYDLDRKTSTAASTDLCKLHGNASKNVYNDGTDGRDNSFGSQILPIILGINADATQEANQAINSGKPTLMISIRKLGPATAYNPLTAGLYTTLDLGAPPKLDGTDKYPLDPTALLGQPPDVATPKNLFSNSYLTGNTWVSGPLGPTELVVPFFVSIPIHSALFTMELSADHAHATKGVLAGTVSVEALTTSMRRAIGMTDVSLCNSPVADSVVEQIKQAADIMLDGSQDPTKECDAISIGIGFEAELANLGAVGQPPPPPPDPCSTQ
jgi:hypothetical protein